MTPESQAVLGDDLVRAAAAAAPITASSAPPGGRAAQSRAGYSRLGPRSVSGCEIQHFGMGPAVVLGQGFTEGTGTVRDGAAADLAAGDRQIGNGHRETARR
jgi:hypothetical protein